MCLFIVVEKAPSYLLVVEKIILVISVLVAQAATRGVFFL